MVRQIEVSDAAKKQLARMGRVEAKRITSYLRTRISVLDNPRQLGDALQGARLGGLWRYRMGDYRILVEIKDEIVTVLLIGIGHRGEVYR
ncbi:type II toxin-antitoxin system RelE/ParE family toxin [Tabrizicola sp.]|uniref:type II toxin-antitoxin system RelE family toxin n=1 Tax=Tabrizicola sp. TaxID=2005166 RepID=UPI0025D497A3|nr:type II toxin-antitoxin system RelE/ParE family toxin [Tabrizicola sp.]